MLNRQFFRQSEAENYPKAALGLRMKLANAPVNWNSPDVPEYVAEPNVPNSVRPGRQPATQR